MASSTTDDAKTEVKRGDAASMTGEAEDEGAAFPDDGAGNYAGNAGSAADDESEER